MVHISEGDEPVKVPLVYYDNEGERHVVGDAAVQIKNGEVIALGQIRYSDFPMIVNDVSIEAFSISAGPSPVRPPDTDEPYISPQDEAARRLGPMALVDRQYVTDTNPNGENASCPLTDPHNPHEWTADPESFFNVRCPGITS